MFVALPTVLQAMLLQYLSQKPHAESDSFIQMLRSLPAAQPVQPTPAPASPAQPAPPTGDQPTQTPNSGAM